MSGDGGWTRVPDEVIRHPTLRPVAKAVYCVLASRADNKTRQCWPGYKTIAAEANVSRRTVPGALEELKAHGFVTWTKRTVDGSAENDSNLYTLTEVVQEVHHLVQDVPQGGAPVALGVVQDVPQGGAPVARELEPATRPRRTTPSNQSDPLARFNLNPDARRELLQSLNAKSPTGLLRHLDQAGELEQRVQDFLDSRPTPRPGARGWENTLIDCATCKTRHTKHDYTCPDLERRLEAEYSKTRDRLQRRRPTTDDRVSEGIALTRRLAAEAGVTQHPYPFGELTPHGDAP